MSDLLERIRVVLFTSGPRLEPAAGEFIVRLTDHPEIELIAVFHESSGSGLSDVIADLWRRRGLLALPVLLLQALRASLDFLSRPRRQLRIRRTIADLADRIQVVPAVHEASVLERVRDLAPDLGLIYGGPILKPALFEIPTFGTLGIHHGKLPEYRGKKTTFWAMFNDEASAGVTIQRVNAGLDTGQIVQAGEVPIGRRPLRSVWNRLEALGIDLYVQAILEVKHGTAVSRQPEGVKGRLYRDPVLADILAFWWRYLGRLVRGSKGSGPHEGNRALR